MREAQEFFNAADSVNLERLRPLDSEKGSERAFGSLARAIVAKTMTTGDRPTGIVAEFDRKAATYETDRLAGWYAAQGEQILAAMGPHAEGIIADIGCGTGRLLRRLVREHPSLKGFGIDISRGMIDTACARAVAEGIDRVQFQRGDWQRDTFQLPPVRMATCVSTFHYFEDPVAALRRIHDALEPGGRVLLLDRATDGSATTRLWDWLHRQVIRDECRFYATQELIALLQKAGFAEITVLSRTVKWFWKKKLHTSLVLLQACKE